MFSFDSGVVFISIVQPLAIGYLFILGAPRAFGVDTLGALVGGARYNGLASRLYECGSYSRLANLFSFSPNTQLLIVALIIYDVDLLFLLPEGAVALGSGGFEVLVILALLALLAAGLTLDSNRGGMEWTF